MATAWRGASQLSSAALPGMGRRTRTIFAFSSRWAPARRRSRSRALAIFHYRAGRANISRDAVGIHICRSQDPNWQADAGYDAIAEPLFNALRLENYFLEYDNARAGTFAPLRAVPARKFVVLGLVAFKTSEVESVDFLMRRIEEASRYIDLEQLGLSPQCGFATSAAERVTVTEEVERAK